MEKSMIGLLGFGVALVLSGCGASPGDTPEETARILAEKSVEKSRLRVDQRLEDMRFKLECLEKEMEWMADRGEMLLEADKLQARIEFYEDNLDKLKDDIEFNITEVRMDKDDEKKAEVKVKFWGYEVKQDGENYKDLDLLFESNSNTYSLIEDDGWKIRNRKKD